MHWAQQCLHNRFGDRMFKAVITETVKLREAPSHRLSIFEYDANVIGAKAYRELIALKCSTLSGNKPLVQSITSKTEREEESLIKNQETLIIILD